MTRLLGGLVLGAVVGFSVGASPYCREHSASVYDTVAAVFGSTPKPSVSELVALNDAEKSLLADRKSIDGQRGTVRDAIWVAEKTRREYVARRITAEKNAVRYRKVLVAAEMNGSDEVVVDRLVFDVDQMRSQIDVLLAEHASLEVAIKSLTELVALATERERDLVASHSSIEHALDRIPLQRAIVVSDGATASSAAVIADLDGVHRKAQDILRADRLLTPDEIEKIRQESKVSEKTPRDSKRLESFLNGDDVFAGTN